MRKRQFQRLREKSKNKVNIRFKILLVLNLIVLLVTSIYLTNTINFNTDTRLNDFNNDKDKTPDKYFFVGNTPCDYYNLTQHNKTHCLKTI